MRSLRVAFVLAAGAFAVSACIPSRDNPYDPSLQPRAILFVNIRVPSTESPTGFEDRDTQIGGISSVFVLDAHQSTDRGGSGIPQSIEFDIGNGVFERAPNEDKDPEGPDAGSDPDGFLDTLVLSSGYYATPGISLTSGDFVDDDLVAGTGTLERVFRVKVTGKNGHSAIAEVPVVIQNSRPSVPSVDVFVAASGAPPVVLDACDGLESACASADPDGDRLHYEWTLERGEASVLPLTYADENQRRAEFVANGDRGWEFRLTAIDGVTAANPAGLSRSLEGRFRVFRSGAFWAGLSQPSRLLRVYPDFSTRASFRSGGVLTPFSGGVGIPPVVEADGEGGTWVAVYDDGVGDWVLHLMDNNFDGDTLGFGPLTLPSSLGFPADTRGMAAFDGGVCLLMKDQNEPVLERYRALRVTDAGTIAEDVTVDAATDSGYAPILLSAADACVVVGTDIHYIDGTGDSNPVPGVTFDDVPAATLVNGELWVVEDAGVGRRTLHVPLNATAEVEVQPQFPFFPDKLLPHPSGVGVLAHSNDSALYHLRADPQSAGQFLFTDEATRGLPDLQAGSPIEWPAAVDVGDAAYWYVDPGTYQLRRWVFRADLWEETGTVAIESVLDSGVQGAWVSLAVDPHTGRAFSFLYQSGGTGKFVQIPPHLQRVHSVPFTLSAAQRLSVDRTSGALYYSDCLVESVDQYCPDAKGFHRLDAAGRVTLTADSSAQLTLATAQNVNGFWAVRNIIGREPGPDYGQVVQADLIDFDRDGIAQDTSFALDPDAPPVALAVGEDGTVCYIQRSLPTMASQVGSGTGVRIKDGVRTEFEDVIECPRDAGVSDDGSCWFVGTPTGNCEGSSDRTRVVRYPPGETEIDTDFQPAGFQTGVKFVVDPRPQSGFWLVNVNIFTTFHYSDAGALLDSFNGDSGVLAMLRVCSAGTDECLETWQADGTNLLRGTADLEAEPLEVIPLGTTGFVRTFSLSPYVFAPGSP